MERRHTVGLDPQPPVLDSSRNPRQVRPIPLRHGDSVAVHHQPQPIVGEPGRHDLGIFTRNSPAGFDGIDEEAADSDHWDIISQGGEERAEEIQRSTLDVLPSSGRFFVPQPSRLHS